MKKRKWGIFITGDPDEGFNYIIYRRTGMKARNVTIGTTGQKYIRAVNALRAARRVAQELGLEIGEAGG
jgi:hypothetical protein